MSLLVTDVVSLLQWIACLLVVQIVILFGFCTHFVGQRIRRLSDKYDMSLEQVHMAMAANNGVFPGTMIHALRAAHTTEYVAERRAGRGAAEAAAAAAMAMRGN